MRTPIRSRLVVVVFVCAAGLLSVSSASAAESGPQWTVTSVARPTNFAPEAKPGEDSYQVLLTNTGAAASDGSPITVTDELPQGLTLDPKGASGEDLLGATGANFSCALRACTYTGTVVPDQTLVLTFPVDVSPEAPAALTNVLRVSGGGAPAASISTSTVISPSPAGFGIAPGSASTTLSSTQAGAHPDITNTIAFDTVNREGSLAGDFKDVTYHLTPGFASDFVDTPTCPDAEFLEEVCPIATQIGVTTGILNGGPSAHFIKPVYNLSPSSGEIAKLGFRPAASTLSAEGSITLRPGDYGADVTFQNTNQAILEVDNVSLTVWGVPADPIHDPLRAKIEAGTGLYSFGVPSNAARAPFFTNPTSCGAESLEAEFSVDSWQHPDLSVEEKMPFGPIVGCDRLGMEPSLTAEATTNNASSPTGLNLAMDIPQTYENPDGLATSTLKRAVVTLPEGMTVNPSAGAGLGACTQAEYEEEPLQAVPGQGCPSESKLGTVKIVTPALKEEVTGSVFLAQPYSNPFHSAEHPSGSLIALYIVARIPDRGVLVRAAGEVTADPFTGKLVATFDDLPPLPFNLFTFRFNQGQTSPLVTPPTCGSYTVQAALTPWSNPEGAPLMPLIPPFPISRGFDGGGCPSGGVPSFAPQVQAGTQDNNAGSYSPFYLRLTRGDGEQEITKFSSVLPPGLSGNLSGIPFCPDAQIALARTKTGAQEMGEPSCPAASEIGHTIVGAGVGGVLAQAPGKVYLAGPYHGSALSIVSVTSARVGPFDLGTVVVRFALRINPITAQAEVDSTGSDPIPHIIRGIVTHVRDIRVYIDRGQFILNPTSCRRMSIADTITGAGADFTNPADAFPVTVASPFQAADCSSLAFKPGFKVLTSGRTSRARGASLTVKLTYPKVPFGTQANIAKVKVDLPKQLPSRLTTLQKACLASTFNANPAVCSSASRVGQASATTPILPVPLSGPAYFVSHGGAKFPELVIVLQGYGITVELHGETFINERTGITSSTFHSIPDVPVGAFEMKLPQGPDSALAATANLCKNKLKMPTAFTAQNGLTIHQSTPINVTNCPKHKAPKKHTKTHDKKTQQKKKK